MKVPRPLGTMGPGDSDYDSSEEGKRRKGYRGDHDTAHRYAWNLDMEATRHGTRM